MSKIKVPSPEHLAEQRAMIEKEVPHVDIKPYSHNLIGITLAIIARNYGNEEANKAIEDFGLEAKGWTKEEG